MAFTWEGILNAVQSTAHTWMDGLLRCPRFDVVCRGSCPIIIVCGLINLCRTYIDNLSVEMTIDSLRAG